MEDLTRDGDAAVLNIIVPAPMPSRDRRRDETGQVVVIRCG
jgi:hypothetical protein